MKAMLFACALGLLVRGASAEITRVGTTAAPFLTIGLGCRALGMGGAYTGLADDASCLYWNPAGGVKLGRTEFLLVKTDYLVETDLNYFGLVAPLTETHAMGLSFTFLDYGEMEVTTLEEQDGTGEFFQSSDMAIGLSYSTRFTDRFTIGFNGKFVQQKIWHMSASSLAFDLGTLFRTGFHDMVLGMGIYNVGLDMEMSGTDLLLGHDMDETQQGDNPAVPANLDVYSWPLPMTFRIGASAFIFENPQHSLLLSVDAVHPVDNSEYVNAGGEYCFRNRFYLRSGWQKLFLADAEGGLTLGGGLSFPLGGGTLLKLDAAWLDHGILDTTARYSLSFSW